MKRWLVFPIATILILSTISIIYLETVNAYEVIDIEIDEQVTVALFHFNLTTYTDSVYIKFGTSEGTKINQTYTDPDDLVNNTDDWSNYFYGDIDEGTLTVERYMFVRGLEPETTYYYSIYVEDAEDVTGSFTTLPRFTNITGFGDEFIDTYLVDDYSDVDFYQAVGDKSGSLGLNGLDSQVTFWYRDGTFWVWEGEDDYFSSATGLAGSYANQGDFSPNADHVYVYFEPLDNQWRMFGTAIGNCAEERTYYANPGSEGSFSLDKHIYDYGNCSAGGGYSYPEPHGILRDSLNFNNSWMIADWHYELDDDGGPIEHNDPRFCGFFYEVPDTDHEIWITPILDKQHRNRSWGTGLRQIMNETGQAKHTYGGDVMIRNGVYIMFLNILKSVNEVDSHMWCSLVYSRDGYTWNYFDIDTPIIPHSETAGYDWGWGMAYPGSLQYAELMGEGLGTDRVYYHTNEKVHDDNPGTYNIAYLDYRHEGFTYAKATGSTGWLRTKEIDRMFAANLTINGNFTASAKLNISILDADTNLPYNGYSYSDFDTIIVNSTAIYATWGSNNLSDIPTGDFKINFSWDGIGSGELYSYSLDGDSEGNESVDANAPQFIYIDGGTNGTTGYSATPTFNWTIDTNAIHYWLHIANDSAFTDLVVNITNINEYTYPSEYDSNTTRVSFTLPTANSLQVIDKTYYCRVQSNTK